MSHTANFKQLYVTASEGLNMAEIASAVGASALDLVLDLGTLITTGNINPWAMYKPVRDLSLMWVNRGQNLSTLGLGNANGVAGPPYATTIQGLIDMYADTTYLYGAQKAHGWRYLRPRGGAQSEYFRMSDFLPIVSGELQVGDYGYNGDAASPFGRFACDEQVYKISGSINSEVSKTLPVGDVDGTMITIGDFNNILTSAWKLNYYGILLVPESTEHAFWLIGNKDTKIFDNMTYRGHETLALEQPFPAASIHVGRYTAYPFLTNVAFPTIRYLTATYSERNNTLSDSRRLFPIPGIAPLTLDVFEFYIEIQFVNRPTADAMGVFDTAFTVKNNYSNSVSISNFMLKFRKSSGNYDAARRSGEVFYDKEYRYDDSYPSGVRDSRYANFLADMNLGAAEVIRRPLDDIMYSLSMPDTSLVFLQLGCSVGTGSSQYGEVEIRTTPTPEN